MKPLEGEHDSPTPSLPPANPDFSESGIWIWAGAGTLLTVGSIIIAFFLPGPQAAVTFASIGIGFTFATAGLVAVWLAFTSYPLSWRLFFGLPTLIALSAALGWYVIRTDGGLPIMMASVACLWGQFIATQSPLWILRGAGGWRLTDEPSEDGLPQKTQFGIGHMMIATAVVGVLLALGRFAASFIIDASVASGHSLEWLLLFATIGLGNTLTTLCVLWFFASRHYWFWLLLAIVLIVAIVAVAEIVQINAFSPASFWETALPFAGLVNGSSIGMIGLLMTLLYLTGTRIRSMSQTSADAGAKQFQ